MIALITYWKEIALAIVLTMLIASGAVISSKSEQINLLQTSLAKCEEDKEDLDAKVAVYEKAVLEAEKSFALSEQKRLEIVAILTEQVNNIRKQNVPKECKAAVQWAKDNKGDLSWSKK